VWLLKINAVKLGIYRAHCNGTYVGSLFSFYAHLTVNPHRIHQVCYLFIDLLRPRAAHNTYSYNDRKYL